MKRVGIFIYIFILLIIGSKSFAQSQFSPVLSKMEKSLFGLDYSSQSDDARLNRIEEVVYGEPSKTAVSQRVDKLKKDLSADLIGQEIKPKKDSFEDEDAGVKESFQKEDKTVDYPVVNAIEDKVFHNEFKSMDINQRLANLEQRVFKKNYSDDLSTRVDRLKNAVVPNTIASSSEEDSDYSDSQDYYGRADDSHQILPNLKNYYAPPNAMPSQNYTSMMPSDSFQDNGYKSPIEDDDSMPSYNQNNSVHDSYPVYASITVPLAALEKSVLRKSYPDDTVSNRLTRLELKLFNTEFTDDTPETRLDRVASAYQAKKSASKYDNNKFTQHMSTAMQVGAILLMILASVL